MRRNIPVALVAVLMIGTIVPGLLAGPVGAATASRHTASMPSPGVAEGDFVARINGLRASRGLPALSVDGELTAAARSWAATMAGEGRIFHASNLAQGVTSSWAKLGENVGVGGDVASLFQAFVNSPSHFENLIDPSFTKVGVGVVVSGDRIYTTHRFMAVGTPAPPPPPPTTQPAPPPPPPPTAPPSTAAPTTAPTTVPPTTTTAPPAPPSKLGPLERIRDLVEGS